jgi:hypothetical protein
MTSSQLTSCFLPFSNTQAPEQAKLFVGMVDGLLEVISLDDATKDAANVKQTALLNLEILSHNFAPEHPGPFLKVI